jgi:Na+/H+ antiporter NhaD/arsenite permease-like protein
VGGKFTITSSVANIIGVEQSRAEAEIGFPEYLKVGLPVTLLTLGLGSLWLWWIG